MTPTDVAKVCHEANRAYCEALGDFSQHAWDSSLTPQWHRDSALAGVEAHLSNPGLLPAGSHEVWMKHKAAEGWKYGPVKDADRKEHPCMVPYERLPAEQRAKDYIFRAIVHALASEVKDGTDSNVR